MMSDEGNPRKTYSDGERLLLQDPDNFVEAHVVHFLAIHRVNTVANPAAFGSRERIFCEESIDFDSQRVVNGIAQCASQRRIKHSSEHHPIFVHLHTVSWC